MQTDNVAFQFINQTFSANKHVCVDVGCRNQQMALQKKGRNSRVRNKLITVTMLGLQVMLLRGDPAEFSFSEIHLWMLSRDLSEDVLFLLLLRCRQTHRFLPQVFYQLLYHPTYLSIQLWQLLAVGAQIFSVLASKSVVTILLHHFILFFFSRWSVTICCRL